MPTRGRQFCPTAFEPEAVGGNKITATFTVGDGKGDTMVGVRGSSRLRSD